MTKAADGVQSLKHEAELQQQEAGKQLKMAEGINKRISETEVKMKKIDSRLEHFVATSSDTKVWIYIVVQGVILMMLILTQ